MSLYPSICNFSGIGSIHLEEGFSAYSFCSFLKNEPDFQSQIDVVFEIPVDIIY